MNRRLKLAALCLLLPLSAFSQDDFVVRDMRVEGLQRISEGTVFNYLPINIGDRVDAIRVQEAIRTLYSQNLFDDIEFRRDGDTLIVAVHERPSIESFTIEGNKDIKTEDLMESLRGVGLAKGRTFDQSVLEEVSGFLREQYYDQGKYGVVVETSVLDRPNNTVGGRSDVVEGDRAKIRQVNIVGNLEDRFIVEPHSKLRLKDRGPDDTAGFGKKEAGRLLQENLDKFENALFHVTPTGQDDARELYSARLGILKNRARYHRTSAEFHRALLDRPEVWEESPAGRGQQAPRQ